MSKSRDAIEAQRTALSAANIGSSVQAYDADTAKLDVEQTYTAAQTFGTVAVTGNVDGRDVSVDGAKLDGIAASANNYSHPTNHAISVVTGLQSALDGKTTESYVNTAVSNLVDSSPAALNTLNELAAALGDDANFSTTTATALGLRVSKDSDTGAASMPTGTTAQRPTGALGMFRHNTTLNQFEGYNDGAWGALAGGDEVSFVTYEYIATAGQTTFSGADSNNLTLAYTVANIIVSYGGQDLPHSDYTATNGTSVVLDDGAVVGEIVRIVAFTTFTVADTYTQAQIDSKDATKLPLAGGTMTGALFIASPNQATGGNALQIRQGNNTAYGIDMGLSQTDGHLNISKVNNGTSTHMMTLARDTGNVGIGNASPAKPLDVTGDIRTSTGILFGTDTAAANTLDDYEEGTWTPVIQNTTGTFTTSEPFNYVKVGNVVTTRGYIYNGNVASASAVWQFGGLPYQPLREAYGVVQFYQVNIPGDSAWVNVYANPTSSYIRLIATRDAGTSDSLQWSDVGTGHVDFHLTYLTT
jgi:hypothetical protein